MKNTIVNINGKAIKTKKFTTLKAANNFMNKLEGRTIVFFKSHQYYVSI